MPDSYVVTDSGNFVPREVARIIHDFENKCHASLDNLVGTWCRSACKVGGLSYHVVSVYYYARDEHRENSSTISSVFIISDLLVARSFPIEKVLFLSEGCAISRALFGYVLLC